MAVHLVDGGATFLQIAFMTDMKWTVVCPIQTSSRFVVKTDFPFHAVSPFQKKEGKHNNNDNSNNKPHLDYLFLLRFPNVTVQ